MRYIKAYEDAKGTKRDPQLPLQRAGSRGQDLGLHKTEPEQAKHSRNGSKIQELTCLPWLKIYICDDGNYENTV